MFTARRRCVNRETGGARCGQRSRAKSQVCHVRATRVGHVSRLANEEDGMTWLTSAAGVFAVAAVLVHALVGALTIWRCKYRRTRGAASLPPVSIIRPMCGHDAYEDITLGSSFRLEYPAYELLLCCASADDPAVPLARRLIAGHPHVSACLLIGNERVSDNPKLNNMAKGWHAAKHPWIVMADSNVLMPPDYLHADVGLARRHRSCLRASGRRLSRQLRCRIRMRLSQHLSGELAIRG
jgi:cellulose synthase/poly-beta-1,6-N-acetylglucosamine synthase-like glycosyltransferase